MMARALVLALLVACGHGSAPSGPPPKATDRDSCMRDEDCTLVDACCGCDRAGRRVAIRRDAVAEYDATRAQRCTGSTCIPGASGHPSCDAEAICADGHCKVIPHLGH